MIPTIQNHLKLAGIKLIMCTQKTENIKNQQGEHFIYVVSEKNNQNSTIVKALQQAAHMPSCFTFLVVKNTNTELAKELAVTPYINLSEQENYYLTIFEILKRILPTVVDLDKNILQLKSYHHLITDQQGLPVVYSAQNLVISLVAIHIMCMQL